MKAGDTDIIRHIYSILENVADPEVPVLSILDLGIVREVSINNTPGNQQQVSVIITPTYSGCPAMDMIAINIRMVLLEHGFKNAKIHITLSPAWTTQLDDRSWKRKIEVLWYCTTQSNTKCLHA